MPLLGKISSMIKNCNEKGSQVLSYLSMRLTCESTWPHEPGFWVEILSHFITYECLALGKLPNLLLPQFPQDINSSSFMGLLSTLYLAHGKHSIKVRDEEEGIENPQDSSMW